MKLAYDETTKAEYLFRAIKNKEYGEDSNKNILTNKRLIIIYNDAEESYPLSKITAVKIKTFKNLKLFFIGIGLFLVLLSMLAGGKLGGKELLVLLIPSVILIILGLRKKTGLIINQMGGEKKYLVRKVDESLKKFIDSVNHSLS